METDLQPHPVTFASGDGTAELQGLWHLPARRATNGALLVLHGGNYTKEAALNRWLGEGAAQLGLTALRFDFRYVQNNQKPHADLTTELDDLVGAYNFLQSFGKEIKPKRLYLVGKSLGAMVGMKAASGPLANAVNGVAALGLPLHTADSNNWFDYTALQKLTCPVLFVMGARDNFGNPQELQPLFASLSVPKELEVIDYAGHSYEPIIAAAEPELDPVAKMEQQGRNQRHAADIVLEWLERQDAIRENLRK